MALPNEQPAALPPMDGPANGSGSKPATPVTTAATLLVNDNKKTTSGSTKVGFLGSFTELKLTFTGRYGRFNPGTGR